MILRKATLEDIPLLIKLRMDYLTEDHWSMSPEEEAAVRKQLEQYFNNHIPDNSFIGILAEEDNNIVSAAYLAISENPANPSFITGLTGTLLNVLTYSEYRRRGIAAKVLEKIIDEAKMLGVSSINLSATSDGKPLYEKLGFSISNYTTMNIKLLDSPIV